MQRHPSEVCSLGRTASVRCHLNVAWNAMTVYLLCVSCRASSQVCRSPEEKWVWKYPALHLQEHSGAKSSLTDETGETAGLHP